MGQIHGRVSKGTEKPKLLVSIVKELCIPFYSVNLYIFQLFYFKDFFLFKGKRFHKQEHKHICFLNQSEPIFFMKPKGPLFIKLYLEKLEADERNTFPPGSLETSEAASSF